MSNRVDLTYIEDVKDPDEVMFPNGNLILVLRVEKSGSHVRFTLLYYLPLNLGHSSVIEALVSKSLSARSIGTAHEVNCSIALSTDSVSSSNRLPFNPRSRAWHTSAQASPSST